MRVIRSCFFGHTFVCVKCPVCEPDELQAKRDENAEKERADLVRMMTAVPLPAA